LSFIVDAPHATAIADLFINHTDAIHKTHHKIHNRLTINDFFDENKLAPFRFCFIGHV
jgi:hypothetical protein